MKYTIQTPTFPVAFRDPEIFKIRFFSDGTSRLEFGTWDGKDTLEIDCEPGSIIAADHLFRDSKSFHLGFRYYYALSDGRLHPIDGGLQDAAVLYRENPIDGAVVTAIDDEVDGHTVIFAWRDHSTPFHAFDLSVLGDVAAAGSSAPGAGWAVLRGESKLQPGDLIGLHGWEER